MEGRLYKLVLYKKNCRDVFKMVEHKARKEKITLKNYVWSTAKKIKNAYFLLHGAEQYGKSLPKLKKILQGVGKWEYFESNENYLI